MKQYQPDWETESFDGATWSCRGILDRVDGDVISQGGFLGLDTGLVWGKWGELSPFPFRYLISTLHEVAGRGA